MDKRLLTIAIAAALAVPGAHAVKYKLSGQINRAVVFLDDDIASDIHHNDNISSGTRWRLTGSEEIGNGMNVGFNYERQISSNPSSGGAPIKSGDFGGVDTASSLRKAEVWFGGNWGKLSIGQGDGAGNGATESDLSDTWNVAYHGRTSFGAAVSWRTGAGGTIGLTHGSTFSEFDAFSRYDRVRYDTPALGPVTVSASVGQNEKWEIAARASTKLGGGDLSASLFYGQGKATLSPGVIGGAAVAAVAGADVERWGGSASFLFSQGTNFTFAYATQDAQEIPARQSADVIYAKLGHKWGNNAVSISYGTAEDVAPGFDDSGWQLGFNHNIPKAKVDLYAGYHLNELDTPTGVASVGDITAFVVGTKLKFD